jgi:hypothetical protein|tara:strand:- start:3679 stop:4080 length:402 start_codon:yes stop_codon:yes gene_type:complete
MISYKKINLTGLYIHDTELKYNVNDDILIIKCPIIIAEKCDEGLILKINNDSHSHDNFMNVCGYIKTLYNVKKINTNATLNNMILLKNNTSSKFFDSDKNIIPFSKLKSEQKVVCSFKCVNGHFLISQCLLVN